MLESLDVVDQAEALLGTTEEGIRDLIQHCLERNRYAVVAILAELADGVAGVRRRAAAGRDNDGSLNGGPNGQPHHDGGGRSAAPPAPLRAPTQSRSQLTTAYPRFEREADRLVKIGWSKNDHREYEHKAPRAAVVSVCSALVKRGKRSPAVTMEGLLPVADSGGQEVPSYQVYLIVAWLRQLGVVERTGKDGYSVNTAQLVPEEVDAMWSSLSKYEARA